eukprot:Rhum_TRINITY_DN3522_c0_g1::Rhum_TRINITY_DN3522_c0_g1_i1::g.11102::m.11102
MRRVLCEIAGDLGQLVLLSKLHCTGPLVQLNACINCKLNLVRLEERRDGVVGKANRSKLLSESYEQRRSAGQQLDEPLHVPVVLENVVELHQLLVVLCLVVVLHSLGPLLTIGVVVSYLVPRLLDVYVVQAALLHELHHFKPVTQPHAQLRRKVLPVDLTVQPLCVVEAQEVRRDLRLLLRLVLVQLLQPLHKLDALVVLAPHKRLLRDDEVKLLQRVFGKQPPQPRVRVLRHEVVRIRDGGLEQLAGVPQGLRLEVDHAVLLRVLRLRHDLVQHHRLDLQVAEGADVGGGQDGLLGIQPSEDVHARLLHHGKELAVVGGPLHVPHILPLERQALALLRVQRPVFRQRQRVEGQHADDVDHTQRGGGAVELHGLRAARHHELVDQLDLRQLVHVHGAALPPEQNVFVRDAAVADHVRRDHGALRDGGVVVDRQVLNVERALLALLPPRVRGLRVQHVVLRRDAAVLPHVDDVFGRGHNVRAGHGDRDRLEVDVLRVDGRADGVAQRKRVLPAALVLPDQDAVVSAGGDVEQLRHRLDDVLLGGLCVPEDACVVVLVGLQEGVHKGLVEVAPLVVRPHVRKVDERVDGKSEAEAVALPRNRRDASTRHLQRPEVLAVCVVELDHGDLLAVACGKCGGLRAADGEHLPLAVPLDLRRLDAGVDQDGFVVHLVPHELAPAVLVADGKRGRCVVVPDVCAVEPLQPAQLDPRRVLHAVRLNLRHHGACGRVVAVHLSVYSAEEDHLRVRAPLHVRQLHGLAARVQLLAPQPVSVDAADDDGAVLVHDADLLPVVRPAQVLHDAAVPVVDHLLEPHALVQHPHDDQPVLVGARQLPVLLVPPHHRDAPFVAVQRLVHRQVACRLVAIDLKLQHLQQTVVASAGNPSLVGVPGDASQLDAVGDGDLLAEVDEHCAEASTCKAGRRGCGCNLNAGHPPVPTPRTGLLACSRPHQ